MATTPEQQLAKLEAARASGVASIRDPSGAMVTYRSMDEMDRAIADLKNKIAGTQRKRRVNPVFDRGL